MSTRIRTTVLATETATPMTSPAPRPRPASSAASEPQRGGDQDLPDRPGQRDPPDRQQVAQVEVHADAEHQQDDADLGQLGGHLRVGHEAGRLRAERDAGQEVADDRRQAQPLGDQPQHQGQDQADRQVDEEPEVAVHVSQIIKVAPFRGDRAGPNVGFSPHGQLNLGENDKPGFRHSAFCCPWFKLCGARLCCWLGGQ